MIRDTTLSSFAARDATPSATGMAAFAEVVAVSDPATIVDAWAMLETTAPCSIYQTRAWLLPWSRTLGRRAKMEPLFILARAVDGTPAALLCLGIVRRGPFRVASFLGAKDSNANLALIRDPGAWTGKELRRLFEAVAAQLGGAAPDAFVLCNQPRAWRGRRNPFLALAHQESPSAAYGTVLSRDAESLFATKLSKDSRKKLRKKEAKLAALGPLTHLLAATAAERTQILDAFLAQKLARFRERGIVSQFDAPEMRAFLESASAPDGAGIELHALLAGTRVVATYGGAPHAGQWSGMFNSFDADEEIAKSSPGDLLLMRIVAKACTDGLSHLDLGIGEARYKAALCDEPIPLFDCIVTIGARGAAYGVYVRARQGVKRIVKRSPRLLALARRLRSHLP